MTDLAHVQTKISRALSESREISVIQLTNPLADPVRNYRTSIDPALVSSKPMPVDQRCLDLNGEPIPMWLSTYGTGLSESEIFHKSNHLALGSQFVTIGDGPWVDDLGPVVDLSQIDTPASLNDNWHKAIVSDLSACDVVIAASLQFPYVPFLTGLYQSQALLFPVSSRHIVKTSDGVLHAVTSYNISGLSRVVYLKSSNGGETWLATVVDNDDGQHYILPSITCDKNNGIHITYTRWDQIVSPTYWLFAGGSTPSGFELVSGSGGIGYHRLLGGGDGQYYPTLAYNPDDYNVHINANTRSGGNATPTTCDTYGPDGSPRAYWATTGWHHSTSGITQSSETILPLSRSLKLLRYMGIPTSIPADIIIPFDADVPDGFTRYSAQDGYHIYCSSDVGTVVGAATHRHKFDHAMSGNNGGYYSQYYGSNEGIVREHTHAGSDYTSYANNTPPSYRTILGITTGAITVLPQHALLLSGQSSIVLGTCLSGVGGTLLDKYLVGGTSYADLGGYTTHDHDDFTINSGTASGTSIADPYWNYTMADYNHYHVVSVVVDPASNVGSRILPYIHHIDSDLSLSSYGNDLFYLYISPAGVLASPVNISLIKQYFPSFEGVCLADGSDNVHFLWSAQGLNTTPANARVSYNKITAGTLGSRVDLTTSDEHMLFPSMDIDKSGDVHASWFNATTMKAVQYKKYSGGAWGAVENVDTSEYVGYPSNIITDKDCNVFLLYAKWTDAGTAIKEVMYRKRTAGTWGDAVNLSPDKASDGYNQYPGQIYLDNKGNVVFTWSGKGYGAHTGVYHPVYRYVTLAGTVVPAVGTDAVDLFPDDDTEIFYPTVFWHSYPVTDQVYQNLVASGFTFIYLYNPRNGALSDTADLKFYSSSDALVGDVGPLGSGGSGDGVFEPGGVGGECVLQQESYTIVQRGYLCLTNMNMSLMGNYMK